jgi:hypothetical protein
MLDQTARVTACVVGWFWATCDEGRRHRVTATRITTRSASGDFVQACTRLSLPDGSEARRVRGGLYQASIGTLMRITSPNAAFARADHE